MTESDSNDFKDSNKPDNELGDNEFNHDPSTEAFITFDLDQSSDETSSSEGYTTEDYLTRALGIVQQREEDPSIRLDAIRFIIDQFQGRFFPILESILNDSKEHPDVRSAAALALGKIGGDSALEILLKHANSDDITVKNYTIQAFGILGREEGVPILINALKDTNNVVFASAAQALGEIGRPAVPYLIDLLDGKVEDIQDDARCVAAWQLGQLRFTEAVPTLVSTIEHRDNPEVQALCIWALGEIGYPDPQALAILNKAKTHQDPNINTRAQRALLKIARHLN